MNFEVIGRVDETEGHRQGIGDFRGRVVDGGVAKQQSRRRGWWRRIEAAARS
jgi:hypothetical protein